MQILSFVLSGVGVLAGALGLLAWLGLNGMYALINLFAYKPVPLAYESYASVYVACVLVEVLFMARLHWGSVLIPVLPLLWAWHLGMIGR